MLTHFPSFQQAVSFISSSQPADSFHQRSRRTLESPCGRQRGSRNIPHHLNEVIQHEVTTQGHFLGYTHIGKPLQYRKKLRCLNQLTYYWTAIQSETIVDGQLIIRPIYLLTYLFTTLLYVSVVHKNVLPLYCLFE